MSYNNGKDTKNHTKDWIGMMKNYTKDKSNKFKWKDRLDQIKNLEISFKKNHSNIDLQSKQANQIKDQPQKISDNSEKTAKYFNKQNFTSHNYKNSLKQSISANTTIVNTFFKNYLG